MLRHELTRWTLPKLIVCAVSLKELESIEALKADLCRSVGLKALTVRCDCACL
jgi:hypothetical protein